jgi:hypothetical protein
MLNEVSPSTGDFVRLSNIYGQVMNLMIAGVRVCVGVWVVVVASWRCAHASGGACSRRAARHRTAHPGHAMSWRRARPHTPLSMPCALPGHETTAATLGFTLYQVRLAPRARAVSSAAL